MPNCLFRFIFSCDSWIIEICQIFHSCIHTRTRIDWNRLNDDDNILVRYKRWQKYSENLMQAILEYDWHYRVCLESHWKPNLISLAVMDFLAWILQLYPINLTVNKDEKQKEVISLSFHIFLSTSLWYVEHFPQLQNWRHGKWHLGSYVSNVYKRIYLSPGKYIIKWGMSRKCCIDQIYCFSFSEYQYIFLSYIYHI